MGRCLREIGPSEPLCYWWSSFSGWCQWIDIGWWVISRRIPSFLCLTIFLRWPIVSITPIRLRLRQRRKLRDRPRTRQNSQRQHQRKPRSVSSTERGLQQLRHCDPHRLQNSPTRENLGRTDRLQHLARPSSTESLHRLQRCESIR